MTPDPNNGKYFSYQIEGNVVPFGGPAGFFASKDTPVEKKLDANTVQIDVNGYWHNFSDGSIKNVHATVTVTDTDSFGTFHAVMTEDNNGSFHLDSGVVKSTFGSVVIPTGPAAA